MAGGWNWVMSKMPHNPNHSTTVKVSRNEQLQSQGKCQVCSAWKILGCNPFWVESEFNWNLPWLQVLFLVFSEISCVQLSVSLNPVITFWVFLLQYDETTLKDRLGCDVCQLCRHVLCVLCLAQLLGLSMQPGLGGCCGSSKADRSLSGSWWLCTWTGTETGVELWVGSLKTESRVGKYWLALSVVLV